MSGLIDAWGNGVLNIIDLLKKNNLALPEFEQSRDFLRIIFKREKTTLKTTQKTTQKIIDMIKENPYIGRVELSKKLENITEDGVKYHLKQLKQKGLLKRIGPDKGGHWEVV